ncbi:alpha/beta hydrolase [Arcicella lustrica]|uniref:Alpha/beta hydrolase family protein n=1 Tax=Arcicella lustrica TaxID=2984196 RepID=A0ABU5SQ27_9BACT|nr:alpha/beta hydrolase family protein [Arcicella sp. DC25W]MEA5429426.1 alpha/beta hydrolase family protein [Arcicella sp. DC25W]
MKLIQLRFIIFTILSFAFFNVKAAMIDSLEIQSPSMKKVYKAAVVLPASYDKNKMAYPVLYLLHGGAGHFKDWLTQTPDKMLVKNLADQYNIIIIMPEGEAFSWYMDSPFDPASQFETHIIKEVIPNIDNTYRTIKSNKGRVIAGLSMGGHGAMYLSTRHPDMFCAAGSMSGAMDMNFTNSKAHTTMLQSINERFQKLLGTSDPNSEVFVKNSIMNMIDTIKKNGLAIFIDCGVDDFLIEGNRELHRRLVYNGTPHDYIERPGGHSWNYWQNALPSHLLFFQKVFKKNGSIVE